MPMADPSGSDSYVSPKDEQRWLTEDEDREGLIRTVWTCPECPHKEDCSSAAWSRADCWSFMSESVVRGRIARHLNVSALHRLTADDAQDSAELAVITTYEESYLDRKRAREENPDASKKRKTEPKHQEPSWQSGQGGWGSGGWSSSWGSGWTERQEPAAETGATLVAAEPAVFVREVAIPTKAETVTLPLRHAVMILDSVNRALAAVKQVTTLARSFASSTENEIAVLSQVLGIKKGSGHICVCS